ncbi:hypothetical protein [Alteromonas facilis]|uniref:hypothetical protein n=1 Tax=Alteromonas facilis TaxID=2048004 RepID=UPI000F5C4DC7|nr:hypothetical protein [Alteromonas facilis]
MKKAALLFIVAALTGCMSQTLQGFVGKDVRSVMVDMGPPDNAFDMGDGRRAFQWVQNREYTDPVTVTTTEVTKDGKHVDWVNSVSTISGGRTVSTPCHYTVFARWNSSNEAWIVEDFKRPSIECE